MSMLWGGELQARLSDYSSAIVKLNMANKYGKLHYSTKAYPSPSLTDEEWEIIFRAATDVELDTGIVDSGSAYTTYWIKNYTGDDEKIEEARTELRKRYFKRLWYRDYYDELESAMEKSGGYETGLYDSEISDEERLNSQWAMPDIVISKIINYINELDKVGEMETEIYDTEVVDRMEKCIVKNRDGLAISTAEQKKNLLRYWRDDKTSSYTIYYDAKTMLPLLSVTENGAIKGWDAKTTDRDVDFNGEIDEDIFRIKIGTVYYKWTRTVKYKAGTDDGILGRTFVINADTFPETYKIVGETYIREYKTGRDQRYQFTINRAQVSSDTNITLEADGDPTTFEMQIDVLVPENDIMIEFKEFDVDEDNLHGGTRIIPQKSKYTYTPTTIEKKESTATQNLEIY